jgi:Flp pilus assembly pilin Flp
MCSRRIGSRRGQGLVEYALILVLVAIAVVVVLTAFGQRVSETFCDVVLKIAGRAPSIAACVTPRITLSGIVGGQTVTGPLSIEALIYDDKGGQSPNIDSVIFTIDGGSAYSHTETAYHFCMAGDDSAPCNTYSFSGLHGTHVLKVTAHDQDGYTGETSITFTLP